LETGGGLKKGASTSGNDLFYHQQRHHLLDERTGLERLARHWDDAKMDFLLLTQSKAKAIGHDKAKIIFSSKPGNTVDWNEREAPYIIPASGSCIPAFYECPDGKFTVKILWHQAIKQNRLACLPHYGQWFQTGTIEDIKTAENIWMRPGGCP